MSDLTDGMVFKTMSNLTGSMLLRTVYDSPEELEFMNISLLTECMMFRTISD